MKLHWSPRSPFVRKVMIVLHETGQMEQVGCVRTVVAVATPPGPEILINNPLGKIPALVLDDGSCLFDSRVICEYLDAQQGGHLLPAAGAARWAQLRLQALGDGVTDILLLQRTEYLRATPDAALLEGFRRKLFASFAALETEAPQLEQAPFGLGHIALVCAIGQLDFRYAQSQWRQAFPALAGWHDIASQRDSVVATSVVDDAAPTTKDTHSLLNFLQNR